MKERTNKQYKPRGCSQVPINERASNTLLPSWIIGWLSSESFEFKFLIEHFSLTLLSRVAWRWRKACERKACSLEVERKSAGRQTLTFSSVHILAWQILKFMYENDEIKWKANIEGLRNYFQVARRRWSWLSAEAFQNIFVVVNNTRTLMTTKKI